MVHYIQKLLGCWISWAILCCCVQISSFLYITFHLALQVNCLSLCRCLMFLWVNSILQINKNIFIHLCYCMCRPYIWLEFSGVESGNMCIKKMGGIIHSDLNNGLLHTGMVTKEISKSFVYTFFCDKVSQLPLMNYYIIDHQNQIKVFKQKLN